jgi:hypothetical protein
MGKKNLFYFDEIRFRMIHLICRLALVLQGGERCG